MITSQCVKQGSSKKSDEKSYPITLTLVPQFSRCHERNPPPKVQLGPQGQSVLRGAPATRGHLRRTSLRRRRQVSGLEHAREESRPHEARRRRRRPQELLAGLRARTRRRGSRGRVSLGHTAGLLPGSLCFSGGWPSAQARTRSVVVCRVVGDCFLEDLGVFLESLWFVCLCCSSRWE